MSYYSRVTKTGGRGGSSEREFKISTVSLERMVMMITSMFTGRKDVGNGEASLQGCRLTLKSGDGCEDDFMQIQLKLVPINRLLYNVWLPVASKFVILVMPF